LYKSPPEKASTRCPSCASYYVRRSHTRFWERPFRLLSRRVPFRCHTCRWRGWRKPDWLSDAVTTEPDDPAATSGTTDREEAPVSAAHSPAEHVSAR